MKPLFLLLASCAVGAAAGALAATALAPVEAAPAPRSLAPDALEALRDEVRALSGSLDSIRAEMDSMSARALAAAPAPTRSVELDVEAAVARYLDEHRPELAAPAPAGASKAPPPVASLFAELERAATDADRRAIWQRAREAGLTKELVALFELRAKERPNDPEAQMALGSAYLQQLEEVPDGPQRGAIATRADKAFDRVLELDPGHWEARFTKAVSLSFWPPLFGKQAEAIRQFEVLVEQQQGRPSEPHFAMTYELLGNLYQQSGDAEQALATWQAGAQLFPDSASLQAKLIE